MNKAGRNSKGPELTMTHADHSCGILDGETILYGGEAVVTSLSSGGLKYIMPAILTFSVI